MIVREVLLRTSPLRPGKWLAFIVGSICLAISAGYEFFEWWTAVATGEGQTAVQFLATQGDIWDTQWDMLLCLCGAVAALLILPPAQDRSMAGDPMAPRRRLVLFLTTFALVIATIVVSHGLPTSSA
jgi:putative membrane protein